MQNEEGAGYWLEEILRSQTTPNVNIHAFHIYRVANKRVDSKNVSYDP